MAYSGHSPLCLIYPVTHVEADASKVPERTHTSEHKWRLPSVDCFFADNRLYYSGEVRQNVFGSSFGCRNIKCKYLPNRYNKKNPYDCHKIFLIGKPLYTFHKFHLQNTLYPFKTVSHLCNKFGKFGCAFHLHCSRAGKVYINHR